MLELIVVLLYSAVESQQNLAAIALKLYKRIAFYQKDEISWQQESNGRWNQNFVFQGKEVY